MSFSARVLVLLFLMLPSTAGAQESYEDILADVMVLTPRTLRALVDQAVDGDAAAQLKVAMAYHGGYGVRATPAEAVKWCRMAADQGMAPAQHMLGVMYRDGDGVAAYVTEAIEWISRAAEQGYGEAEADYGLLFFDGVGVSQNHGEAFKWFSAAAEHGSVGGTTYLGIMLVNGLGAPADLTEGHRFLNDAARAGSPMAQANLGALYANGAGVEQNATEALVWFFMAEAGGFDGVGPIVADFSRGMSEGEVTELKRQAQARLEEFRTELSGETASEETNREVADEEARAQLAEFGEWVVPTLVELGTFSVDITRDMARARVQDEVRVTLRGRNTVSDVELDRCMLHYTTVQSLDTSIEPLRWEMLIPLNVIDLAALRVERYQLPDGWRMVGSQRSQITLRAAGYPNRYFAAVTPEGWTGKTPEIGIPIKDRGDAQDVMARLREAATICGAQ